MGFLDKQMLLRDLEAKLGAFIPANDVHKILIAADEALADYEVTSAPNGGGDFDDSLDLLKYFIEAKRIEGRAEKTVERYEYLLRRFMEDMKIPFSRVTVYHIRNYFTQERERGISTSTLEGYRSCYNSFFGWLHREGLIRSNPMANLTAIKQPKVVRHPYSAEELAKHTFVDLDMKYMKSWCFGSFGHHAYSLWTTSSYRCQPLAWLLIGFCLDYRKG